MCLIITKTANGRVDWQAADRSARYNSDGYGVGYATKQGKATSFLSMSWLDVKKKAIQLANQNQPFVLHMRMATHGAVTKTNCHPIQLPSHNMVMAHNGIISTLDVPTGMSDSRVLASFIDEVYPNGFLTDDTYRAEVTELCKGFPSKLSFIDGNGNLFFINEDSGAWKDGVWYSVPSAIRTFNSRHFNPKAMMSDSQQEILDDEEAFMGNHENISSSYSPSEWLDNYQNRRATKLQTLKSDIHDRNSNS